MSVKSELIRLGNTNPELRPHIRAVLSSVETDTSWYKEAAEEITPELLDDLSEQEFKALDSLAKDLKAQRGKVLEAIEASIRGDAIVVTDSVEYQSRAARYEFDFERQRFDDSIGGMMMAYFNVDAEDAPKASVLKAKLGRVYQDHVKGQINAKKTPESVEVEVSDPRKQSDGSWLLEIVFHLWWMI